MYDIIEIRLKSLSIVIFPLLSDKRSKRDLITKTLTAG